MELKQVRLCPLNLLHRVYVPIVLLNLLASDGMREYPNGGSLAIEVIKEYELGLLVLCYLGRVDAERCRLVLVDVKVES